MKMPAEGLMFKPQDSKAKTTAQHKSKARGQEQSGASSSPSHLASKTTEGKDRLKSGIKDPLAEFYAEAKAQAEHNGRAGVRS